MNTCPKCGQVYDGAERFCPKDGTRLGGRRTGLKTTIPPQHDKLIGTVIQGRYRVIDQLGEGGMGVVYTAEHVEIEKKVALKVLRDDFSKRPEVVERFRQEARAASKIGHENIVDVTDFGQLNDGGVYFVMEHLAGMSLSEMIQNRPVALNRAVPIIAQIAHALQAAHGLGIVHRDLKPENIFLTTRGNQEDFVKILDFGIAKIADRDTDGERLTKTGMIFGTPEYMSPEQASGKSLDHRVDVYALGCIMFELLTGRVPFDGESFMAVLTQHMFEPVPDPAKVNPDPSITDSVRSVVYKAMSKNADDRYGDMTELRDDLERAVADSRYVVDSPGREGLGSEVLDRPTAADGTAPLSVEWADSIEIKKKKNKRSMAVGAVLALALAALGAWYYLRFDAGGETPSAAQNVAAAKGPIPQEPLPLEQDKAQPQPPTPPEEPVPVVKEPAKIEVRIQTEPREAVIFIEGLGQVCSRAPCNIALQAGKPVEMKAVADGRSAEMVFTPSQQNQEVLLKIEKKKPVKRGSRRRARTPTESKTEPAANPKPSGLKIPGIFKDR